MKILVAILACTCCVSICRAQTENKDAEPPVLNGEWKLDSIVQKQGKDSLTALLPSKIIPKKIYYSCPVKMIFTEQAGHCRLVYENEESKDVAFYVYKVQKNMRFHAALLNDTPVPEWSFDYSLTITQIHLTLSIEYRDESAGARIQYEYFYSLIQ